MPRRDWTREELIVAFNLYCKIPFGNFERCSDVVFRNPNQLSRDLITKELREAFMQDGLFIAHQIRIPDAFLYSRGEGNSDDHCYHEFDRVELSADAPTDLYGRSITELLSEVRKVGTNGWIAFYPHEALRH